MAASPTGAGLPMPSGKRKERSRSKKRRARSESSDSDDGAKPAWMSEEDEQQGLSTEARLALLEVENATLKAENKELRKKLMEVLRQKSSAQSSKAGSSKEPAKQRREREADESPPRRRQEREPAAVPSEPAADRRRERLAQAEAERPAKRRRPGEQEAETHAAEAAPDPVHQGPNAVMLANGQMEVYNEPITNNVAPEKRLPLVQDKLERFLSNFADKVTIVDLKSGKDIIKDKKTFNMRYSCVFRESGAKLKGIVNKRCFYDAPMGKPTYCLDFETHQSLVTATPGTKPDGSLGVRDPRTEHLMVLYEEKAGKLTRMWVKPDGDKLGLDPNAGEDILERHEAFKAFEEKVAELKGGSAGSRIFHNYHNTPIVG